jgi:hypothetical protein
MQVRTVNRMVDALITAISETLCAQVSDCVAYAL